VTNILILIYPPSKICFLFS